MQLTDRIRQVKIFLVVAAIIIAVVSLLVSRYLVQDLASEERNKMEVWAEAMRALNKADENTDMNLVLKVIDENNTIPVVVLDSDGQAQIFRNLKVKGKTYNDTLAYATEQGLLMKKPVAAYASVLMKFQIATILKYAMMRAQCCGDLMSIRFGFLVLLCFLLS